MEIGTKEMKALKAGSADARAAAEDFCQEALTEAKQRASLIEQVCELRHILDHETLRKATGALAGVRHITMAIESVAEAHRGNEIGQVFRDAHAKLSELHTKATREHRWLSMIFRSLEAPVAAPGNAAKA